MKLSDHQFEFLKDVVSLISYAMQKGFKLTFGEVYRTEYQQKWYVEKGYSSTMKSMHLKRLAVDINFFLDDNICTLKPILEEVGMFWKSLSPLNRWGGDWTKPYDPFHFERHVE